MRRGGQTLRTGIQGVVVKWPEAVQSSGSTDDATMPLTAALLMLATKVVSFATPGHRSGRSCRVLPHADAIAARRHL